MVRHIIVCHKRAVLIGIALLCINMLSATAFRFYDSDVNVLKIEPNLDRETKYIISWLRGVDYDISYVDTENVANALERALITLGTVKYKIYPKQILKGPYKNNNYLSFDWSSIERKEIEKEKEVAPIMETTSTNTDDTVVLIIILIAIVIIVSYGIINKVRRDD